MHPLCSFNQEESDFDNKELWDDYLETSEDISEGKKLLKS